MLADEIARLKAWCASNNVYPARGDLLRVEQAARYLGRAPQTISNWFTQGVVMPTRIRGRSYIAIPDLAALVIEG